MDIELDASRTRRSASAHGRGPEPPVAVGAKVTKFRTRCLLLSMETVLHLAGSRRISAIAL